MIELLKFFAPKIVERTQDFFMQEIPIPIGLLILLAIGVLYLLFKLIRTVKTSVDQPQTQEKLQGRPKEDQKTEFISLPKSGVLYALKYPTDKEDVIDWVHDTMPRCLKCQVFMTKGLQRIDNYTVKPISWFCNACGHSISLEENDRQLALAKSELLSKLGRKI